VTAVATAPAAPATSTPDSHGFRSDIEGLRALAVLAVVAFHAGIPGVGGGFVGVDVFYVLSGFLITGLLVSEVERTGRISLSRFWARRARRLLPAASLVLVVTAVASAFVLSPLVRAGVRGSFVTSALYSSNWWFAHQGTDYLAAADAPSPVQHYWSLGVEEQFYVVWPLLVLLVVLWLRVPPERRSVFVVRRLAPVVVAVWVLSFWWCVHESDANQPYAFFGSPARAWELATGALVAVLGRRLALLPRAARSVLGWAGLTALVGSIVLLAQARTASPYPGMHALWPTLGTAALVTSGLGASGAWAPARWLSVGPLRGVGRLSYSWYLWHWPPLVLGAAFLGHSLSLTASVLTSVATLGMAWVTYHLVEQPFRFSPLLVRRARASLATGLGLSAVGAVASFALLQAPGGVNDPVVEVGVTTVHLVTGPAAAARDASPLLADGCQLHTGVTAPRAGCVFGDPAGTTTVYLLGDSHASQWFPALEGVAVRQDWRLTAWTKGACPLVDAPLRAPDGARFGACRTWVHDVIRRVRAAHPDLVLVSGSSNVGQAYGSSPGDRRRAWVGGLRSALAQLEAAGTRVVLLQDTPEMTDLLVPDCLAQKHSDLACSEPRSRAVNPNPPDVEAARSLGLPVVDLANAICGPTTCHAVIGRTIVWLDHGHLTASFAATLADQVAAALRGVGVAA
jgi:peptidoglycan/LPS O-acetylase OafA/YrhL